MSINQYPFRRAELSTRTRRTVHSYAPNCPLVRAELSIPTRRTVHFKPPSVSVGCRWSASDTRHSTPDTAVSTPDTDTDAACAATLAQGGGGPPHPPPERHPRIPGRSESGKGGEKVFEKTGRSWPERHPRIPERAEGRRSFLRYTNKPAKYPNRSIHRVASSSGMHCGLDAIDAVPAPNPSGPPTRRCTGVFGRSLAELRGTGTGSRPRAPRESTLRKKAAGDPEAEIPERRNSALLRNVFPRARIRNRPFPPAPARIGPAPELAAARTGNNVPDRGAAFATGQVSRRCARS